MDYKSRIKALRKELGNRNLNGIIIVNPSNRRYLSGFTGSAGVLYIDSRSAFIATDSRYYIQVKQQCPDFTLLKTGYSSPYAEFMKRKKLVGKRIAFESDTMTVSSLKAMRKLTKGVKLVPTERIVMLLRSIKCPDEIKNIQAAQNITDNCFKMLMNKVKTGMTEKEIAWMIEVFQREAGAKEDSFDAIVASGPNSALPHAVPSGRKVKKGEPLLFDYGCRLNGYCSDMTRMIFFGKPSAKMEMIYNRVLEAHLMVYEMSSPGTKVADVDKISRDYIYSSRWKNADLMGESKGQARYEHGLGHGVGIDVHELPVLSQRMKTDLLKVGQVVTNEPGIYVEGEGGVRIEDMMHITEDGAISLTKSPKEMIVL